MLLKTVLAFSVVLIILVGCGRKSDPIPEKDDGYPHPYPNQKAFS